MSLTGEDGEPVTGTTNDQAGQHDSGKEVARALEDAERTLAEVSAALNRLDDQSFGRCEMCGKTIDEESLSAQPTTTRCAGCRTASGLPAAPD